MSSYIEAKIVYGLKVNELFPNSSKDSIYEFLDDNYSIETKIGSFNLNYEDFTDNSVIGISLSTTVEKLNRNI